MQSTHTLIFRTVLLVSGAVSAMSAGGTAATAPALPHMGVDQLVEKNIAARGGLNAWRSVNAISYSGNLDAGKARPDNGMNPASTERVIEKPGKATKIAQAPEQKTRAADEGIPISLPYTLIMERPAKQRVEIKFKDETLVQVYDGTHGWKLQPYLNRGGAIPFNQAEMSKAKQFQDIDGPLIDYTAKGTKVMEDGTDMVDGRPAYRLKLALKSGATRRVWIDAATFLDVQVDGTRTLNGRDVPTYTTLRDFRGVQGVKVPFEMETRTQGLPEREKIIVQKVAVNPPVDDHLFAKPN